MRSLLIAVGLSFALLAGTAASAADAEKKAPSAAQQAQRDKMTSCNAEAKTKNLAGAERKTFMKGCLSNKPAAAPATTAQQDKMKTCNKQAGDQKLKGDARKSFMSGCLKG